MPASAWRSADAICFCGADQKKSLADKGGDGWALPNDGHAPLLARGRNRLRYYEYCTLEILRLPKSSPAGQ